MIPQGWQEKTLGDILDKGSSALSANKLNNCQGEYPVYGASGLVSKVNFYQQDKEYLAIIKDGAGVGRVYHYEANSSVLGTLQYLFPKDGVNIRFAYYYLQSIDFAKYYQGAAIPHIYYSDYKKEKIILPPLPEQERIVAKLDEAFEAIDKVKANVEQNLSNTIEMFNNILDSEIKSLYKRSSIQKLSEVCDVRDGTHDSPKYLNHGGHPFITSKNLKDDKIDMSKITYISDEDYKKINERSKVDIGDVLFAMIGTIGNPVVITEEPTFAIKNIALFKNINKLEPHYLRFLLKSHCVLSKMQEEANGTTQKFVSLKYLRNFLIPVPPLFEQQKIVEKLDALQEQTKQLEQIYTQKIKACDELKQSIFNKAFKGEL